VRLNVLFDANFFDLLEQSVVLLYWAADTREEVKNDIFEERKVILQELWHADISECSEQKLLLVHIWEIIFQQTSSVDD